jgi:hypothetical protein
MSKSKRKSLSKSLRFEVLKRDKFTCQYCGGKAPDVLLQVDHIDPVANGGRDVVLNLVTSCQPCNSGKSDRLLSDDAVVTVARKRAEEIHERREQIKMLADWHMSLVDADLEQAEAARAVIERMMPGRTLSEPGFADVRKHVKAYGLDAVLSQFRKSFDERARPDLAVDHALRALKWKAHNERDPIGSQARYLRGIAVNRRCATPGSQTAFDDFSDLLHMGAGFDALKRIATESDSPQDLFGLLHDLQDRVPAEVAADRLLTVAKERFANIADDARQFILDLLSEGMSFSYARRLIGDFERWGEFERFMNSEVWGMDPIEVTS